ncbi:MAG: hypothetical protein IJX92_04435 [Clostridia bacterium]|nr:hypothetical protein [Clostridia bacterium]
MNTKGKYNPSIPREMYLYFVTYSDKGAPSFEKFAKSKGITTEKLLSFRSRKRFAEAFEECRRIRHDLLVDGALTRTFDPSFVKFLLGDEDGTEGESDIRVSVEVI